VVKRVRGLPGMGNSAYAEAMRELRKSNAAQPHQDRRTRRARSRDAKLRRAVKDDLDASQ